MPFLLNKKTIIIFAVIVVLSFFAPTVFAVWNGTFYEPGDTLNPECLPTDVDCDVRAPLTSLNISDTVYGAGWDTDTTHAPSKNALYDKIEGLVAGSHDPISLGVSANGLSLATQVLSLDLSSTSTTGALSDTDWDIFNNKQNALGFTAVPDTRMVNGHALSSDVTVTASDVSLGNVTNESKATMFTSPTFTGTVAGFTMGGNLVLGANTLTTSNTGLVSNLNADLLDGQDGSYYASASGYIPYTGATTDLDLGTHSLTSPLLIGGSSTTQDLTFKTTTGIGATGADMHFLVGNNGATEAMTILGTGLVGIGTAAPSYPLDVVTGTSWTDGGIRTKYALRFGTNTTQAPVIFPFLAAAYTGPDPTGKGLGFFSYSITAGDIGVGFSGDNLTNTTGNYTNTIFARTFAPTSGTGTYTNLNIGGTINQTGGANGITRGLYISSNLTAAADYRAIETTTGSLVMNDTYLAGSGSLAGSLLNLAQTWNTTGAPTGLKFVITDTASNSASLAMQILGGAAGTTNLFKVSKAGNITTPGLINTGNLWATGLINTDSIGPYNTNTTFTLNSYSYSTASRFAVTLGGGTHSQVSGTNGALKIAPIYNQVASTAANTDLLINRTETSVGSGAQYLIDAQVGGVTQFNVTNAGVVSAVSLVSCGGIQTNGSGTMSCTSDERLKDLHGEFTAGLASIMQINPETYSWRENSGLYDGGINYSGFIAQNIESAIPEAVNINPSGYRQVNTTTILAATINAIKEMNLNLEDVLSLDVSSPPLEGGVLAESEGGGSFFSRLLSKLTTWLADATNGIAKIFVGEIETKSLCVSDDTGAKTCITKSQLDALLASPPSVGGVPAGSGGGGGSNPAPVEPAPVDPAPADPADSPPSEGGVPEGSPAEAGGGGSVESTPAPVTP